MPLRPDIEGQRAGWLLLLSVLHLREQRLVRHDVSVGRSPIADGVRLARSSMVSEIFRETRWDSRLGDDN
jgi:hypothetical protein